MKNPFPRIILVVVLTFLFSNQSCAQDNEKWLDSICENFREKHSIVGMTIAVVKPTTSYYSVSGFRKLGEEDLLTLQNNFFIASLSKAFTAFIAKKMEEDKSVSFDTKFFDFFPELLVGRKAEKYAKITLGELLSHKAKINDAYLHDIAQVLQDVSASEQRYHLAKLSLSKSPKRKNKYSNVGYIMAGMLLEKVAGVSYETLVMQTMEILDMSYTIGYPKEDDVKDTWGHNVQSKNAKSFVLSDFNFYADFQLPCWGITMNTIDYAKFLQLHLNGLLGEDNILKSESYKALHQTYKTRNYGWETKRLGKYTISMHDGSGDVFFARAIIVPEEEVAISIFINQTATSLSEMNTLLEEIIMHYKK